MKFTLTWLLDHLETMASPKELAERLTMIGHEVDSVENRGAAFEEFVVAEIVDASPHPDADKLKVCTVNTGAEHLQVVCGAPNARAGLKGVFAPVGATIPQGGIKLKRARIRGVESFGMLLSEREMELSDDHGGIIELSPHLQAGTPAAEALGLADPVFDVGVTPNRADCLGVRGLARDLAAAGVGTFKPLALKPIVGAFDSDTQVHLEFPPEQANACPYFVGRMIRGVRNAESPDWLKHRLQAVGLRPISALVDITNYLTIDLCRPLHVFDADKLRSDLHVRFARTGETLAALNGQTYALTDDMTVIADDQEVESLGGVMGGERTACTAETVNVFFESALFDPIRTARTGRALNILSDARFRFERGIDPSFLVEGLERATRMVLELCGGEPSTLVIAGAEPPRRPAVRFRASRVKSLTGVHVEPAESADILERLGFDVEQSEPSWSVLPPPWRVDIEGEACIVEEVARMRGYDRIPITRLQSDAITALASLSPEHQDQMRVKRVLVARGLTEAVTFSFISSEFAQSFGDIADDLRLVNPISVDLDVMRPSLLPNLLSATGRNADRGTRDICLFEVGPQYAGTAPESQRIVASGIRAGRAIPRHWAVPSRPVDAFDAKADVFALLEELGAPVEKLAVTPDAPAWYHPGRSGVVRLGPKTVLAYFGEIHPGLLPSFGIRGGAAGFEVFPDSLPQRKTRRTGAGGALALSPFQPVERDFAFIVDRHISAGEIIAAIRRAEKTLITDVSVFDEFFGEALGEDKKSLAISVTLQSDEKTLTDSEIEDVGQRIIETVKSKAGGTLRS
ncbi:MAG: phenylalanine--tRNA ligase subunit beta [Hyphomicrobiales bacterium]|nr:phenylalanine--tRNA ligase subunit beta [Hyphomicrobiales bacterium]